MLSDCEGIEENPVAATKPILCTVGANKNPQGWIRNEAEESADIGHWSGFELNSAPGYAKLFDNYCAVWGRRERAQHPHSCLARLNFARESKACSSGAWGWCLDPSDRYVVAQCPGMSSILMSGNRRIRNQGQCKWGGSQCIFKLQIWQCVQP